MAVADHSDNYTNIQYDDDFRNANHDVLIISIVAVFSILSFTAIIMRLLSRRLKSVSFDWDDYLAVLSWVRGLPCVKEVANALEVHYFRPECGCCIQYA